MTSKVAQSGPLRRWTRHRLCGRTVNALSALTLSGLTSAVVIGAAAPAYAQAPAPYVALNDVRPYRPLSGAAQRLSPAPADSGTVQFDLPFDFWFFGQRFRTVYVNANGIISVSSSRNGFNFATQTNPSVDEPDGFLAALWDDWCSDSTVCVGVPNPGNGVFYEVEAGRVFRVEWRRVKHFRDDLVSSDVTFQMALFAGPTGRVEFSYGPIQPGRDAINFPTEIRTRIGLESPDATSGGWLAPCDGPTPCSTPETVLLTDTRVTLVADLGPDVSVADATFPATGRPGLPLTGEVRVQNYHREMVGPVRVAAFLVAAGRTSTVGATRVAVGAPLTLAGYDDRATPITVAVPDSIVDGEYRVAVVVDDLGALAETDEGNNVVFSDRITIGGRGPDFVAGEVRVAAAQVAADEPVQISYRIDNAGNQAGTLRAQLYVSSNPLITSADPALGDAITRTMSPGEVVNATVTASLGAPFGTGPYWVGLIADVDFEVEELDETNNVARVSSPVVVASSDLAIVTSSLPRAVLTSPYSAVLSAAGGDGDYRFVVSNPPPGISARGAVLEGIPTQPGVYEVGVEVESNGVRANARLPLLVDAPQLGLTPVTGPLPDGAVGRDYQVTLRAIGGQSPYRWVIADGRLPTGVTLGEDGVMSGEPVESGAFPVTVTVADVAGASASVSTAVTVQPPVNLTITSPGTLPVASLNESYRQSLVAVGGVAPRTWTAVTVLPEGFSVTTTGEVVGTAETIGRSTFRVRVRDAIGNTDLNTFVLEVASDGRLVIAPERLARAEPDVRYAAPIRATGGRRPFTWSIEGDLPPGLTLQPPAEDDPAEAEADIVLRGTPSEAGLFPFTLSVVDDRGRTAARPYAVWVEAAPPPPSDDGCRCVTPSPGGGLTAVWVVVLLLWARRRRC